jgi:heat shock protein HtpX
MDRINVYVKTTILLAVLTSLFILIGYYFNGTDGMVFALIIALIFNFISYWFSDKIVLSMSNAKKAQWSDLGVIKGDVEKLCKAMKIPMPELYMMESNQPNAFATGRDPEHSVVCVTTGLLHMLEREQIVGVIAHELSHIKNYDVLIGTVAAVMVGAISALIDIVRWTTFFDSRDKRDQNPIAILFIFILAPIIAIILQFAISRSREYEADRTAATYTKNPEALASALVAIDGSVKFKPMNVNSSIHSLFIHSPINSRGVMELFSTHPLTEKRVEKLMNIKV